MYEQTIYVSVALKIQSVKPITEEVYQEVVGECKYNFAYDENGVRIVETEVKEISTTYLVP